LSVQNGVRVARWFVVADDTTGSLDSALGFLGVGTVEYRVARSSDADVVAISTGSRARAAHDGPAVTRAVAAALGGGSSVRVFAKVDSTLRGWPAQHVEAIRNGLPYPVTAVVCPAAPGLGRTVQGGRVFVQGVPASRSAAARDPVAPLREDRLTVLFDAPVVDVTDIPDLVGVARTLVVDASTARELDSLAGVIEPLGDRVLAVGSSGLAAAVGALQVRTGALPGDTDPEVPHAVRGLVLVTSAHPVARQQVEVAGGRWPVVAAPPMDSVRVDHDAALAMARDVADAAALLVDDDTDAVIVVGGDGTDALLLIATKSGGFGAPDTLDQLITTLMKER
jgi:uncharacterized protein YgbK (DUF1537 family)